MSLIRRNNIFFLFVFSITFIALLVFSCVVHAVVPSSPQEKDSTGRKWILKDWEEGTRPYPQSLREREQWYRNKWGENWYGPSNGRRIHNPGNWKWEVVATVPPNLAAKIASKKMHSGKPRVWGDRFWGMGFVWAPGGTSVTDIYALTDNGIYHYNPTNKKHSFIGQPEAGGLRDGAMDEALLRPGGAATLDPITGRLYFIQKIDQKTKVWRYVEKLLPYNCMSSQKICYLPAVLECKELYRRVKSPFGGELKPVDKKNNLCAPVFVVRSNSALKKLNLPGAFRGKRPLITPDGKGVWLAVRDRYGREWDTLTLYDQTALFDIERGKTLGKLKLQTNVPRNFSRGSGGPGTHGGNCMGYDGLIYTCQHGGCTGGPGRMFSIDPKTGAVTMLYDSMASDGSWKKVRSKKIVIDGPSNAKSLVFTSTLWQVQCPRTGAIINGGWDNSGIRRYHDGFVTTIVNGDWYNISRPGWENAPGFRHGNSNPSVAPNGDLYVPDVNSDVPRILRIYRTDWPDEQPVNGYAEKFMPKERVESLMLEYARKYIENYEENSKILNRE
jgi:hypothetical protein